MGKKEKTKHTLKHTLKLPRPPIVAVLGHVDHGKTTLLDQIRKANQAGKEFGGITQHIGAYQVKVHTKDGDNYITLIDTPGHEAFSKIRSRGARVTDLVILVVSAVEGVKPQTVESIEHIKQAGIPFIVAATKMDLPEANIDRVKKHLAKVDILTEGYGGEVVVVPVSAKTGTGIEDLLEMILLIAEMKGLTGSAADEFEGIIIESKLDNKRGPLGTVLVKKGILKQSDEIFMEGQKVKIRAMFDEYQKLVKVADASKPVEVLGFNKVPPVGAVLSKNKTTSTSILDKLQIKKIAGENKQLKVILKADTFSSLEAITNKLTDAIYIVDATLGDISESEILKAEATKACVIGFNIKASHSAKKIAEESKVLLKIYTIIYELINELEEVARLVAEGEKEIILGVGKIAAAFTTSDGKVAGIKVVEGKLSQNDRVKLIREDKEISTGRILHLRIGKDDVQKVQQGEECGARLSSNLDFRIGDMLKSIKIPEIKLD